MKPAFFLSAAAGLAVAISSVSAMPLQFRQSEPAVGARQSNTYHGPGSQARGQGQQSVTEASAPQEPWMRDQEVMRTRKGGTEFVVRIENISSFDALVYADGSSQAAGFSHGVYAVHATGWPVYEPGAHTPFVSGLEALAEDGNVRPMQPYLERHPDVVESGIFYKPVGHGKDAELWPGVVYEFRVTANPGENLSFATMLMQSNDIIYGPGEGRIALFDADGRAISGDVSAALGIFDAGTEINEDPKTGPNVGLNQSGLNTGFDEEQPVRSPDDGFAYPAPERVLKVTIQPVG